jgi:glyoxylase-like metal-dependent hydrolase (beta-lactamase superfamily II)/rhodanese-related sulfurtransferase
MFFKQFYLGCLAQASYMIGSGGIAAVVDPRRDIDAYLEEAEKQHLRIRHVIETHLHADFVSGHRELAQRTRSRIYFGGQANAKFDHQPVRDGDEIAFGDVTLRFLETPGHTPESVSVLVFDRSLGREPQAVLTGDTLFIGDVGRPDLLGAKMSAQELAGMLYDSLHQKLLTLPDTVAVYPAHGAGSLCGRNISSETSSSIGQQRRFNYALQPMPREEFIRMMTTDLPEAPAYFSRDVQINREGAGSLSELPEPSALTPDEVEAKQQSGAVILDARAAANYGTGHVPGSLNIGLGGQFASWAGALIAPDKPIVLVTEDDDQVAEARTRLARVGLENVAGYLDGGVLAWHDSGRRVATTEQINVDELQHRLDEGKAGELLDVRRPAEWESGHIPQARHFPLNDLPAAGSTLPRDRAVTAICAGGYRSSIATSILEQQGFTRITNVVGGMAAWNSAKLQTVA